MIKNYKSFVNKPTVSLINEGIVKNFLNGFWDFFKNKFGKKTWLKYAQFLKTNNKIDKKKIEIYDAGKSISTDNNIKDLESEFKAQAQDDTIEAQEDIIEKEDLAVKENKLLKFCDFSLNEERVPLISSKNEIDNVSLKELKEDLITGYKFRNSGKTKYMDPLFIWGAPGIGKTEVVVEVAEELNLYLIVWHLSMVEPVDFIGLPSVDKGETIFNLPRLFPKEGQIDKGGIIFLDELNRANTAVLAASLQLLNDGKLGEYKVPSNWWVVAAGNRDVDEPGRITEFGSALSGRISHVNLVPTVKEWLDWGTRNGKLHEDILAFFQIKANQDEFFHNLDPDKGDTPWANPRSWTRASELYTFKMEENNGRISPREIERIFRPKVGMTAAIEFTEFLQIKDIFTKEDIEMVWTNPSKAKVLDERLDQMMAIMVYIAFWVKDKKVTPNNLDNIFQYASNYEDTEMTSVLISMIEKIKPEIRRDKELLPVWMKRLAEWNKRLKE